MLWHAAAIVRAQAQSEIISAQAARDAVDADSDVSMTGAAHAAPAPADPQPQ